MKIGYHMKQVRERLAKGLVDKGILRTEKRNFLLFDMATHPVVDGGAKNEIRQRVRNVLTQRTVVLPSSTLLPNTVPFRYMRTVTMVCAAYAANVLENALSDLGHEQRERAFAQVDELLVQYSQWPFARAPPSSAGAGSTAVAANLGQAISDEVQESGAKELQLEVRPSPGFVYEILIKPPSPPLLYFALPRDPDDLALMVSLGGGSVSQRTHAAGLDHLISHSSSPSVSFRSISGSFGLHPVSV